MGPGTTTTATTTTKEATTTEATTTGSLPEELRQLRDETGIDFTPTQMSCLVGQYFAHPELNEVKSDAPATPEQARMLLGVYRTCLGADGMADILSAGFKKAAGATPAQVGCIHSVFAKMSEDDLVAMLSGAGPASMTPAMTQKIAGCMTP